MSVGYKATGFCFQEGNSQLESTEMFSPVTFWPSGVLVENSLRVMEILRLKISNQF